MAKHFADIIVEIAKLRDYCLSDTHLRGRHKARVFRMRLGLTAKHADLLRQTLLDAAHHRQDEFQVASADKFGQRYFLDLPVTANTRTATIRSTWIVLAGEDKLRLTSCYVLP